MAQAQKVHVQHEDEEAQPVEVKEVKKAEFDIDGILDEIDGVLEEDAEEFVRLFVQKGGE